MFLSSRLRKTRGTRKRIVRGLCRSRYSPRSKFSEHSGRVWTSLCCWEVHLDINDMFPLGEPGLQKCAPSHAKAMTMLIENDIMCLDVIELFFFNDEHFNWVKWTMVTMDEEDTVSVVGPHQDIRTSNRHVFIIFSWSFWYLLPGFP